MSFSRTSQTAKIPERDHRRQAFWQIYLPAFLGAVVFIALCVWVVLFTIGYTPEPNLSDQQSPAAKVAVIWILLPTCLGSLIPMALLGGTVYLLGRGIRGLPAQAQRVQEAVWRLSDRMHGLADRIAQPVINVTSAKSGFDRLLERLAFWKHSA